MKLTPARLLFAMLALTLLSLLIAGLTWAQGTDTPIIITDGSMTMESSGVAWSQFTGTGSTRRHPNANKTVSSVDLTVNGNTQTITFANEPCAVALKYGGTTVTVVTNRTGKGLQVSTNYKNFRQGATANHLAHTDDHNKIGAITVKKSGKTVFTGTGNGGTKIVIHYQ